MAGFEKKISPKDMPLYRKGKEINEVINQICELIPDDNKMLQHTKALMLEDSVILSVKVAGATAGGLYDIKMEAATFIRKAAMELMIQSHALEMFGFEHAEYYTIVRKLIEEYRLLFIEWVNGFDKEDYVVDRWGLFNPPGVGPFDPNPDDDLLIDEDGE